VSERPLPGGGFQYVCTRAELAGIGYQFGGDGTSDGLAPQGPGSRQVRQGLAKLRAVLEQQRRDDGGTE
jgi:hypothetical protein